MGLKKRVYRSMCYLRQFSFGLLLIMSSITWTVAQDLGSRSFKVVAEFDDYEGRSIFKVVAVDSLDLSLSRGQTVTFDLSDPSLASHPFNISDIRDGTHSGGNAVMATRSSDSFSLTLTSETPSRLYFFCDFHSGMGDVDFFSIVGDTRDLFQSDYNEKNQELYIPRIYVDSEPPTMYSIRLGLQPDQSAFQLLSASKGYISQHAVAGRRQATYDMESSEIRVPLLIALGQIFQAKFGVDSDSIKLTDLRETEDNVKRVSPTPAKKSPSQSAIVPSKSGHGSY